MVIIDDRLAVIQPLSKFWYQKKVDTLDMLRLDLLHPVVSGNKWYKLRLNLKHAIEGGFKTVVTSGGGFSNHLIATAFTARAFGLKSVGIVRGKYDTLTPTLEQCKNEGMELIFVTQEDYKNQHEPDWARNLVAHFDETLIIPEGGANEWGRAGAGLLNRFIKDDYTHIVVAVGSGTTLTGIRNKTNEHQHILGFVPMKQGGYLKGYISDHLQPEKNKNWQLFEEYHFGGFGKWNDELLGFMNDFYRENNIPLDLVYTSKMMYGIQRLLADNYFCSADKILCIHSGGLQGNVSVRGKLCY
jgi:1-aminocyclopropane-1-carboxylate deaminase/D-cysteine desulfhydrase-like pyridoxal-dependent ACC family enzyme